MIEGVILATGLEPIPKEYVQGMTLPFKLAFEDQFRNEISAEAELSVDRSTKPRPRLVRPTSIYDSDGVGATSEPGVSPNLNVGRVPDPDPELLKKAQMVRERALSDGRNSHSALGTIFGG